MTIEEFNKLSVDELIKDFDTYLARLYKVDNDFEENVLKWMKEYDMEHDIFDRQDKTVGEEGNTKIVEVAKLGVPFQKKIVKTATSFLFGKPVNLINESDEDTLDETFKTFTKAWKDAKLDYHNRRLSRRLFVETRVAELFYIRAYDNGDKESKDTQKKLKVMLLCKENGDDIFPIWDELGDMSGFIRKYQVEIEVKAEKKKVDRVEIYTAAWNYNCTKGDDWEIIKYENVFGKIPVIYYQQDAAEWDDVQTLIDRLEIMLSKNADTNDYFGAPAVIAKGDLVSAPDKNDVGKFFEIKPTISEGKAVFGDISYLTWDMAPEAIKQEYDMLKDLVYSQTSTPDLSFNNVKGTSDLSGIALKFMFFDSILKANNKQEIFGEGLDRRNNLLKVMLSKADLENNKNMEKLEIEVEFAEVLPENVQEMVETLTQASGGGAIMARDTAVRNNPLVEDAETEIELLEKEDQKAALIPDNYGFGTE